MIRVVLDGLVKRYERLAVVDGASLEIRPGELTYLLGPSGAGKTTLARLVAGLETPDEGEIYFDGRVMQDVPPQDRRVGFVFQEDALWPHLTVAENVGYSLKVRGVSKRERRRRVAEALGVFRIDSLGGQRPEGLSEIQRRRVALARAMIIEPEVLLVDEPLARVEPRDRPEIREELRRIHGEGEVTLLVLTSDAREALAHADRLAVMDLGRILQDGVPAEVYNHPADTFVAQLLGPANLLQGQLEGTDARGESIVRTPIGRLVGQGPPAPLASGAPVTVVIRPEALSIAPNVPPGCNRFAAMIERQVFLGETRQLYLRGPGDWPIMALALQSLSQGLREGQSLTVSFPPEAVLVLPSKFAAAPAGGA
jgi:ABC-type Fe3+/spermidine/putrescine transport system ATPase subunit